MKSCYDIFKKHPKAYTVAEGKEKLKNALASNKGRPSMLADQAFGRC